MSTLAQFTHLALGGVDFTGDLTVSIPLLVVLASVIMFIGRNAWAVAQLDKSVVKLEAQVEGLKAAQGSMDGRMIRMEGQIGTIHDDVKEMKGMMRATSGVRLAAQ